MPKVPACERPEERLLRGDLDRACPWFGCLRGAEQSSNAARRTAVDGHRRHPERWPRGFPMAGFSERILLVDCETESDGHRVLSATRDMCLPLVTSPSGRTAPMGR
jgi:hypothetical protein